MSTSVRRREPLITFLLGAEREGGHFAGVTALASTTSTETNAPFNLISGSRDGTVRLWADPTKAAASESTSVLEAHTDWVNALAVLPPHRVALSASSDHTVAVWKLGSQNNEPSPQFLLAHSDYVNSLAVLDATAGTVASAGLRGEIVIWDLKAERCLGNNGQDSRMEDGETNAKTFRSLPSPSIYSIAAIKTTTAAEGESSALLAVGSVDKVVRVWDSRVAVPLSGKSAVSPDSPRTSSANAGCVYELRGHSEPIRSIVSGCGDIPIFASAGVDCSIRYWDLRHGRVPVYALNPHHQSIWAMKPYDEKDLTVLLSADKGGHIRLTNLQTGQTKLVASISDPVLCMHLARQREDVLFVGSTSSSILGFKLDKPLVSDFSGCEGVESIVGRSRRIEMVTDTAQESTDPVLSKAEICLDGHPSVLEYAVCPDKRTVVARYSNESVILWDVLKMDKLSEVKPTRKEDEANAFRKQVGLIQEKQWYLDIPTWFTSDIKLGCLGITLDVRTCFKAERYAGDLNLSLSSDRSIPSEFRVNFGELLLRSTLARKPEKSSNARESMSSIKGHSRALGVCIEGMGPACLISASPEAKQPVKWRKWSNSHNDWDSLIPTWIQDFVLVGRQTVPEEPKMYFRVHPAEGSSLPHVPQPELHAPRIIRIQQIARFVKNKIQQKNQDDGFGSNSEEKPLQFYCLGVLLAPKVNLASIKKYIWKKPDVVLLHYSEPDSKKDTSDQVISDQS